MPRPKGLSKTGGRQKGSLNKTTLLKLERRVMFDELVSQKWEEVINKLKPEYIADQFMGKTADKLEVTAEIKSIALTEDQITKINEIVLSSDD